jgi:hypothetical protein
MNRSLTLLLLILIATPVLAGGGPENVALVVNADVPDSVTVADEYAKLRSIPPCNLIRLSGLPTGPKITVQQFRELILQPVLAQLTERGLRRQVDYVVYSCGFPFAVDVSADMAGRQFPRIITQPASLTGLTYLYEQVLARDTSYLSMDANYYARPLKQQNAPPVLSEDDQALQAKLEELLSQVKRARREAREAKTDPPAAVAQWLNEAEAILQALTTSHKSPDLLYDLACVLALQGKPDAALAALQAAYDTGWWNGYMAATDSDLTSLRERADFKALVARMRSVVVESEPAQPFSSATLWSPRGEPKAGAEGRRYLISSMLAYVGPAANTLEEGLASLRAARSADGTCPTGTIYYMESTDSARTGPRQPVFQSAAAALHKLGVKSEVRSGVLPKDCSDVMGAAVGIAKFSWQDSGSKIIPGAFCDHLTSFGGVMTGTGQTPLSEFIRYGAAGACGTVTEPYAIAAKFPSPFLHVYYASGCSLGEAFYQAVKAPYQQLLVGDPLCQPWAVAPQVQVEGLQAGQRVEQSRWLRPTASGKLPVERFELYVDGVLRHRCEMGERLRLDVSELSPGQHEARVVALVGPLEISGRVVVPFRR